MSTTEITRPAAPVETPPTTRTAASGEHRAGWMFAAPFLVLYVLFLIGPVVIGLVISLFNTATVKPGLGGWVGLDNYLDVLTAADFWHSMWHSALFALLSTPFLVVLPLILAVFAVRMARNQWFYRLAFFAPYVVPSSAVCLIFGFMYTPESGLIGKVFTTVGLPEPNFLGSTNGAWFAVTLLTLWWTLGFNFILYTAALQDIPEETYEAAAIDGATGWQQIRLIAIPLLRPTISLVLILQILSSLKVFDQIYILLAGGPNQSTRPVIEYIFDTGFTSYRGGYAAAATMVYFAVLVVISAGWALLRRRGTTADA
jgi:multiple sugar transport system permease protein